MSEDITFGQIVKERRSLLDLTQTELARRVGCAAITIRKIEADALRPSVQMAELIALALNIPQEEQLAFVRLARAEKAPSPIPTPAPAPGEIGLTDLSGRAVKGFQLGEKIGSGGYGVVYRALQPSVERDVAVKIILPRYANHPNFIRRFEAEAQLVARLEHPHIVPLYDYWREPDAAYLIMRLLRGGSLEDQLKNGRIPLELASKYTQQIGLALDVAHRYGVIHRDIKPANVLLDEEANAYLADFGIAKNRERINGESLTEAGALIGSPAYISPEQILAEPVKPQSDIYCLGILLYEMLTGHKPFDGPTPIALIQQHLNATLPSLREHNPDLPEELDAVILQATARNAADRFPDVPSLLRAFQQALPTAVTPIELFPVTPIELSTQELAELENPYKGLRAFAEADADHFYGRATLIQELFDRLSDQSELARFLAIVGPSGSGKSSVAKAGLVPALRRGGLPGSGDWFVLDFTPGAHPWEEVEAALLRVAVNPPASLLAQLQEGDRGLLRAAQRILPDDGTTELVLIIDQFEEIFTQVEDEAVREHFMNSLVTAVLDPRSRLRLILTLRADFYDRPLQYVDFGDLLRQRTVSVLPMTPDELEVAIVKPALRTGVRLEPGLAAAIIRDVGDQPGTLPLLQYALTELFEKRDKNVMTLAAYRAAGGVTGALARRADEIYEGLAEAGQAAARQLFLRLITLGEGASDMVLSPDTRRRVRLSELEALSDKRIPITEYRSLITEYGRYRLLTFDHDPLTREPTVEVAHEALLREWGRLRTWLAASRNDIRRQRQLTDAATQWADAGQDPSYLLRGNRLIEFAAWVEMGDGRPDAIALTKQEHLFLDVSLAAREQRQLEEQVRQRRELETARQLAETERKRAETETKRAKEQENAARRLRWLAVGLTILTLVAGAASLWAWQQTQRAEQQTRLANARELAAAALSNLPLDPERSILLALEAVKATYAVDQTVIPEAETVLHQSVSASHTIHTLLGHREVLGTSSWVTDIAFSPDGSQLVTASGDNTVKVWEVNNGEELLTLTGDESPYGFWGVAISPDGTLVAAGSSNNSIIIWDVQKGEKIKVLGGPAGHTDLINRITFTSDGRLASTSLDGTLRIWDIASNRVLEVFSGIDGKPILDVALSPDGTQMVTGGDDMLVVVRGAADQPIITLAGHDGGILGVAFSPDGAQVASGSSDGTARVWDLAEKREIHNFSGHTGAVWEVAFSPDGSSLVTASADGTVKSWDLATGKQRLSLAGHSDEVLSVAISPDGTRLATGSKDQTARIWRLTPSYELSGFESGVVYDMAISSDGNRLATTSARGTATLWDLETGQALLTISDAGHERPFDNVAIHIEGSRIPAGVALSPDGRYLAVGHDNGRATIWDVATGQKVRDMVGHRNAVNGLAFSPDGARLATTSEDMTAKMWDVQTGEELLTFEGHQEWVWRVFFSPDGSQIVTTSPDDTAIVWDSVTGELLHTLSGHSDKVSYAAFSPDGAFLTTVSGDGSAKIWDLESGQHQTLFGHNSSINNVTYSQDGTRLATAGSDGTVRIWDSVTGQELIKLSTFPIGIGAVMFYQDTTQVITANWDNTIRVSTLSVEVLMQLAQQRLTRSFTEEECQRFLHRETCPAK